MNKINKGLCLTLSTLFVLNPFTTFALSKDETVFATLNKNGKLKKVTVSEHLINDGKLDTISDYSNLKNIKNVNGDEKFTTDDSKLTWEAKGNDIYYQGNSDEKLPINIGIKYYLDGKEISSKKLKNKKGHVKIELQYTNTLLNKIGGKDLYTPFVVITEMILPTQNNSNVKITNGKVISTGTNYAITGITSPGLYESLKLSSLQNFDKITIEYDTKKYTSTPIYSVATSKVIDDSDFDNLGNTDYIFNQVNQLVSASGQIQNGSKSLLDGSNKLKNGSNELNNGITTLKSGIEELYNGASKIKAGVDSSVEVLKSDNSNALDENTINAIKNQASTQATLSDEMKQDIGTQAIQSVRENDKYKAIKIKYDAGLITVAPLGITDDVITICANGTENEVYTSTCSNPSLQQLIAAKQMLMLMEGVAYQTSITTAQNVAIQTAEKVSVNVANQVANQVKQVANTKIINSLTTLSDNIGLLKDGIMKTKDGSVKLSDGSNALNSGINELTNGVEQLHNGISTFNQSGINKISNLVNFDLKNKLNDVKQLKKLSDNYQSFANKNDDTDGNTKFIIVIK